LGCTHIARSGQFTSTSQARRSVLEMLLWSALAVCRHRRRSLLTPNRPKGHRSCGQDATPAGLFGPQGSFNCLSRADLPATLTGLETVAFGFLNAIHERTNHLCRKKNKTKKPPSRPRGNGDSCASWQPLLLQDSPLSRSKTYRPRDPSPMAESASTTAADREPHHAPGPTRDRFRKDPGWPLIPQSLARPFPKTHDAASPVN